MLSGLLVFSLKTPHFLFQATRFFKGLFSSDFQGRHVCQRGVTLGIIVTLSDIKKIGGGSYSDPQSSPEFLSLVKLIFSPFCRHKNIWQPPYVGFHIRRLGRLTIL